MHADQGGRTRGSWLWGLAILIAVAALALALLGLQDRDDAPLELIESESAEEPPASPTISPLRAEPHSDPQPPQRSPASLAALEVTWEELEALAPGAAGERRPPGTSPFAVFDRPVLVHIVEDAPTAGDTDGPVVTMFRRNPKLALMTKAFRAVQMSSDNAAVDNFTKGHGTGLPRLLVIDPLEKEVTVFESNALDAGRLRKLMTSIASDIYKERLGRVVEAHLLLLEQRDTLARALPALRERERDLHTAGASARLEAVRKEIAETEQQLAALAREEDALWRLTFARQDRRR